MIRPQLKTWCFRTKLTELLRKLSKRKTLVYLDSLSLSKPQTGPLQEMPGKIILWLHPHHSLMHTPWLTPTSSSVSMSEWNLWVKILRKPSTSQESTLSMTLKGSQINSGLSSMSRHSPRLIKWWRLVRLKGEFSLMNSKSVLLLKFTTNLFKIRTTLEKLRKPVATPSDLLFNFSPSWFWNKGLYKIHKNKKRS